MKRAADMFPAPGLRKPRSKANMRPMDGGPGNGSGVIALMQCPKCEHDGGWWDFDSYSEARRGVPCPKCNASAQQAAKDGA